MTPLENEITALKKELISMWILVQSQLNKAKDAMVQFDKDLAREVLIKEKRVNAFELKIDRDCENIFALYCPVAVDLRFLLAALKINTNLERIGDIAAGIALYIVESSVNFDVKALESTSLIRMYDEAVNILIDTRTAFEKEDTVLARSIFKRDDVLDAINENAPLVVAEVIKADMNSIPEALYILSVIRKLERVGDQSKNIAEEIIFYVEAKILKHLESSQKHIEGEED
ncbi:phosphate signaling complex protein PhoU [Mucilaginibacter sp. BJC16-A38]|uniref:phosphate signaling complex protein PhoU n=1 Tax=Mucilaginibacter phenanthrenivorans TaxID=1234842 RepID=UPI002157F499|nr:phosphate signaling complex protein PhoU [Mucilaginibacter phenanthrenivorans]MCR8558303.1 phosphate signaling complex protein PhoU [Mucilaginibacter phenanthrenivorans]MDP9080870.1 phosphate signaling complex protein PhoU [Bacteroidota bacterium]